MLIKFSSYINCILYCYQYMFNHPLYYGKLPVQRKHFACFDTVIKIFS